MPQAVTDFGQQEKTIPRILCAFTEPAPKREAKSYSPRNLRGVTLRNLIGNELHEQLV